jgi:hypothetical protein
LPVLKAITIATQPLISLTLSSQHCVQASVRKSPFLKFLFEYDDCSAFLRGPASKHLAVSDEAWETDAQRCEPRRLGCNTELADSLKQWKDLCAIGCRRRAANPKLLEGTGGVIGIHLLK